MRIRLFLLLVALMALGVTTVFAAKPSNPDHNVVAMSNGFPSGPHFNLNIHGKANFNCPQGPYGGSVFIPEYQSDFPRTPTTIEYVASKGKGVSGLTVSDACAQAFDEF